MGSCNASQSSQAFLAQGRTASRYGHCIRSAKRFAHVLMAMLVLSTPAIQSVGMAPNSECGVALPEMGSCNASQSSQAFLAQGRTASRYGHCIRSAKRNSPCWSSARRQSKAWEWRRIANAASRCPSAATGAAAQFHLDRVNGFVQRKPVLAGLLSARPDGFKVRPLHPPRPHGDAGPQHAGNPKRGNGAE
jgi:hypothetical protein